MYIKRLKLDYGVIALVYKNGRLSQVLEAGKHWLFSYNDPLKVVTYYLPNAQIVSENLKQMSENPLLEDKALFVDLMDNERALVWIDGRFDAVLGPGLYGFWTQQRKVKVEVIDASSLILKRPDIEVILKGDKGVKLLQTVSVPERQVGLLYVNGEYREQLSPGTYAFWKGLATVNVKLVDTREQIMDIAGQDVMTRDKVTLRLNAQIAYRITDPRKSVESTPDAHQALYREAQLALRAEVGSRVLDTLLTEKEGVAVDARASVAKAAGALGIEVVGMGLRDVILPGDMKELMNKVIEAQKASEANAIKRREETAAMRSQMNTAKLIEGSPTLMKLRELEVLEAVAKTTNLSVVLGEEKLTERLTKLI